MKRDVALRIDALLQGAIGYLDMIVHYMKNNQLSDEEYRQNKLDIARSMGKLIEISNRLHESFPDIVPDELRPPQEGDTARSGLETEIAARFKGIGLQEGEEIPELRGHSGEAFELFSRPSLAPQDDEVLTEDPSFVEFWMSRFADRAQKFDWRFGHSVLTRSSQWGLVWRVDFELGNLRASDTGLVNRLVCWGKWEMDGTIASFGQRINPLG
jgi:hypothetical protein